MACPVHCSSERQEDPRGPTNGGDQSQVPEPDVADELRHACEGQASGERSEGRELLRPQQQEHPPSAQHQVQPEKQVDHRRAWNQSKEPQGWIPQAREWIRGEGHAAENRRIPERNLAPRLDGGMQEERAREMRDQGIRVGGAGSEGKTPPPRGEREKEERRSHREKKANKPRAGKGASHGTGSP